MPKDVRLEDVYALCMFVMLVMEEEHPRGILNQALQVWAGIGPLDYDYIVRRLPMLFECQRRYHEEGIEALTDWLTCENMMAQHKKGDTI
jgi:hypothetical protein